MQPIINNDLLLKKRLQVLKADIIKILKNWFDASSSKDTFFTECVQNDWHCAYLSNINGLHLFWDNLYIYIYIYTHMYKQDLALD